MAAPTIPESLQKAKAEQEGQAILLWLKTYGPQILVAIGVDKIEAKIDKMQKSLDAIMDAYEAE